MSRAATVGELEKFRSPGQWSRLNLAIQHPATVYSARINQDFFTSGVDGVVELAYDGGSGTLANVLIGMTILIGSAAGKYDKGICRVRQLPSATKLFIGQTSDITFTDNDYITIVNELRLWPRDITNAGGVIRMDYDIEVGSLTNGGIIPRIGPLVAVLKLVAGTVTFTPPDPSLSAPYDGATIVSYLYAFPGAPSTANLTSGTGTASATYTSAGEYRWSCTITDSLGRETVSYRWVFVDPDPVVFNLESCGGDFGEGDWSFEVTCYAGVERSAVQDRALVTLYADMELYDGVAGSIGKIAGYENILASGWIDGESITFDSESGEVNFTVRGAGYWLGKLRAYPIELQDTYITPINWKEIQQMSVDKALAHILYWTSTATLVMDCFFTGDENHHKILVQPGGFLKDQLSALASEKMFANVLVNNYGQLFVEVDTQIIDSTARAALPVVMDITKPDWIGALDLERVTTPKTAMVELAAVSDYQGGITRPIYARAPGNTPHPHGSISSYNNYVIYDQAECNRIAGCLLAMENNEYEPLEINLSANNRLLDIAPRMYCTISVAESDTLRGIVVSSARIIPRKVDLEWDKESGALLTTATFEFEAIGADGIEYFPPTVEDNNLDSGIEMNGLDFPGMGGFPTTVPPEVITPCNRFIGNSFTINFSPRVLTGSSSILISKAYFPCTVRATGGLAGETHIDLQYRVSGDAAAHITCYAVSGESRVLTGAWVGNTITFSPASDIAVDGFEIELDAGAGAIISKYEPGAIIETGISGVATTKTIDETKYYCIEGYAGYWIKYPGATTRYFNFRPGGYYFTDERGGVGYSPDIPGFALEVVFPMLYAEPVILPDIWDGSGFSNPSKYGRLYWKGGAVTFSPNSVFDPGAVAVGFKWALREAYAIGRQITIGGATLFNVCAITA
jgi:hypothetical protein